MDADESNLGMTHPFGVNEGRWLRAEPCLEVSGAVDVTAAPRLLDAILRTAFRVDAGPIVVDLADVPAIDASGLAALMEAHRRLLEEGIDLRLVNVAGAGLEAIVAAGLDAYLHVNPPEAHPLGSSGGAPSSDSISA